jgi:flagellar protein FliO/FliZ
MSDQVKSMVEIIRMLLALGVTLALLGLVAVGMRRFGPDALARLQSIKSAPKRLAVIESLMLDPQRRLVLIRVDQEEKLLLLGDGKILIENPTGPAPPPPSTPDQTEPAA